MYDSPEVDERSALFAVFDTQGPRSMGHADLRAYTDHWPTTATTPSGVAGLLRTAREICALAMFRYELFADAAVSSLTAVEAGLRVHFDEDRTPLVRLINQAHRDGVVDADCAERLHLGRQLRNSLVHRRREEVWAPGMAAPIVASSHQAVVLLYPDSIASPAGPGSESVPMPIT